MGRSQHRPVPLQLGSSAVPSGHRSRVKELTKPSYKTVFEQVTQQKKKLYTVVCTCPGNLVPHLNTYLD